jgi:hypothetical protein
MMDEKKRFRKFIGILVAMIVLGSVFVVGTVVAEVDNWYTIASAAILVSIAVVAIFVAWRRREELKCGFPLEDERSRALKMRAGHLALFVSMYFCLALGWIIGAFVEDSGREFLSVGEMMFVLVAVMGIFYAVILAVLSRGKGAS